MQSCGQIGTELHESAIDVIPRRKNWNLIARHSGCLDRLQRPVPADRPGDAGDVPAPINRGPLAGLLRKGRGILNIPVRQPAATLGPSGGLLIIASLLHKPAEPYRNYRVVRSSDVSNGPNSGLLQTDRAFPDLRADQTFQAWRPGSWPRADVPWHSLEGQGMARTGPTTGVPTIRDI